MDVVLFLSLSLFSSVHTIVEKANHANYGIYSKPSADKDRLKLVLEIY